MISVIVPYWNSERWIGRCVRSMKTNEGDFEFILVNDQSDDQGEAVARAEAEGDARFRFIDNKNMRGPSGARNTGIEAASGEWITFIDADDEMLPDAFRIYADVISQADANIHQLNHLRYYTAIGKTALKYWNQGGWYGLDNLPQIWLGVWNKIFRAEFLKDIRFNESMTYGEDGMFVLECLAKDGRIHHGSKHMLAVMHRFDNKESLSHVKTTKDMIKQVHQYEKFMLKQKDQKMKRFICKELARLWNSKTFECAFAPDEMEK